MMMKLKKIACGLGIVLLMTGHARADLILMNDDFSSSAITSASRFTDTHINGGWVQRSASGPDWGIASGVLTSPAATTDDEKGLHLLNSFNTTDTSEFVTVSFDYTVGAGSTLYFHSALYTGANATTGNMSRITQTGGAYFANGSDFNANFTSAHNLADGSTPTGAAGTALVSLAGSTTGTFTQTYDISGYAGGGSTIADFSHILGVFTLDTAAAGAGAVSIDNFSVTAVPEPSSLLMLLGGLGMLTMRRRRA